MRKKVLIYVQAYNAEKTLERCLKSIEMQTYKEFECVIYDNGSKDDTEKIANRFSEKDGRFIVVQMRTIPHYFFDILFLFLWKSIQVL